jgi:5-methylcytosine-specific restriction endonuclease McrA
MVPSYRDRLLLARDRGVCALCGLDALEVFRQFRAVVESRGWERSYRISQTLLRQMGIGGQAARNCRYKFWEADHVLPVCRGGAELGLENYRTLCYWCHKRRNHHSDR